MKLNMLDMKRLSEMSSSCENMMKANGMTKKSTIYAKKVVIASIYGKMSFTYRTYYDNYKMKPDFPTLQLIAKESLEAPQSRCPRMAM
jgi:hypothetical protein